MGVALAHLWAFCGAVQRAPHWGGCGWGAQGNHLGSTEGKHSGLGLTLPLGSFFTPLMPHIKLLKQSLAINYLHCLDLWLYVTWSQTGAGHRSLSMVHSLQHPALFSSHSVSYCHTAFSSNLVIQKSSVKKSIFKLTFEIMSAHSLSPT